MTAKTPALLAAAGLPVAYMRRFAFDGLDVMKLKKADRPKGWFTQDVTTHGTFPGDVALYAGPASNSALLAELMNCAAIVEIQNGNRIPEVNALLERSQSAIADALRNGTRPQSFAERERDLLNANNRYLERARSAERVLRKAEALAVAIYGEPSGASLENGAGRDLILEIRATLKAIQ